MTSRDTKRAQFTLDPNIIGALPVENSRVTEVIAHKATLLGRNATITVETPVGGICKYFLKIATIGATSKQLSEGEYESLKAISGTLSDFVPVPYAWGTCETYGKDACFLLEEFRELSKQPAEPVSLATRLAHLHQISQSPTGKFGFHPNTCHGRIVQQVSDWDTSWSSLFQKHLGHFLSLAMPVFESPSFNMLSGLTLTKVVPRLLLPLQENSRVLKPSLLHGDCWDMNTATDSQTGEAIIFDVCSFYGHNEYDIGNWRAPRHELSKEEYVRAYKDAVPPSEPVEEWDARNRLYSLTFNIGNALYVPGSVQRQVVHDDMKYLCKMYCAEELAEGMAELENTE